MLKKRLLTLFTALTLTMSVLPVGFMTVANAADDETVLWDFSDAAQVSDFDYQKYVGGDFSISATDDEAKTLQFKWDNLDYTTTLMVAGSNEEKIAEINANDNSVVGVNVYVPSVDDMSTIELWVKDKDNRVIGNKLITPKQGWNRLETNSIPEGMKADKVGIQIGRASTSGMIFIDDIGVTVRKPDIIDDFDNGDVSKWNTNNGATITADAETKALKISYTSKNTYTMSRPEIQLNAGDILVMDVYASPALSWGQAYFGGWGQSQWFGGIPADTWKNYKITMKDTANFTNMGFQFSTSAESGYVLLDNIKVYRASNASVDSKPVPKENTSAQSSTVEIAPGITAEPKWFENDKYGLFVHYVPSVSIKALGGGESDINVVADAFDAQQLADDAEAFGMQYVVFTALHYRMRPLYPSAVTEKYRPGNSSERDVIQDLINALKPKGIKLVLYVHASDGYDYATDQERIDTGWYGPNCVDGTIVEGTDNKKGTPFPTSGTPAENYPVWNEYIQSLFAEMGERYGEDLDGFWVDMVFDEHHQNRIDKEALYEKMKVGNPDRAVIGNLNGRNLDPAENGLDYHGYEIVSRQTTIDNLQACQVEQICPVVGGAWTAAKPMGEKANTISGEDLYKFTVANSSASDIGGVCWAAGTYIGGGWEDGVKEMFTILGDKIKANKEAILDSEPSTSFVTTPRTAYKNLNNIVATTSKDNKSEYIHIIKDLDSNILELGVPADNKVFYNPQLLNGENTVTLNQTYEGVTLSLPEGEVWPEDAIIKLSVLGKGDYDLGEDFVNVVETTPNITFSEGWKYSSNRGSYDDNYNDDLMYAQANGSYFEYKFTGVGIDYIAPQGLANGTLANLDIYLDGELVEQFKDPNLGERVTKDPIYSVKGLENKEHILKIEKTGGYYFHLDAFRVYKQNVDLPLFISNVKLDGNNITADCKNLLGEIDTSIIIAQYKDGNLVNVDSIQKTFTDGEEYKFEAAVTECESDNICLFVWDKDILNPISGKISIDK